MICGVSGQDGAYLARHLLSLGYRVAGTSRDAETTSFKNLYQLGIRERVETHSMAPTDFRSVLHCVAKVAPDELYNLAGQSSVGLSFQQPVETLESISLGTINLLEAIRFTGRHIKFYNAGSSECFGDTGGEAADEDTPFRPRSPYAVAKAAAHWLVVNYRNAYGLHASNGISFNHESPLRHARFVTKKIVSAACAISRGEQKRLKLGNLDIARDWGAAHEYVDAMWRLVQLDTPTDLVIATGRTYSLESFVAAAFAAVGLNWRDHVDVEADLQRPSDIAYSAGDPSKAAALIDWRATSLMPSVVKMMVDAEQV